MDPIHRAGIVIVGEVHGAAAHHAYQAELAAALHPSAVVFEQFDPAMAQQVTELMAEGYTAAQIADRIDWQTSGWPDLAFYITILEAAENTRIYGAALPREQVRLAISEGAAAVFTGDAIRYGLLSPLPTQQQAEREQQQAEAHCNMLPPSLLPGFVEAQRLRDASFAQTALIALEQTGGPVLIITGNGHARTDWGIPFYVHRVAPMLRVHSIGQVSEGDETPFDARRINAAPLANDAPCQVFG